MCCVLRVVVVIKKWSELTSCLKTFSFGWIQIAFVESGHYALYMDPVRSILCRCVKLIESVAQWTDTQELRRLKGHLAHPRHCGVRSLRGMPAGRSGRKPWVCHPPNPPPSIVTHPRGPSYVPPPPAPCGIRDLPTLGSHSHKKPHMGVRRQEPSLMPFWFSGLAFSWRGLECVRKRVSVCVCSSRAGCSGEEVGLRWQELWCRCPQSQRSLMNGNCCDGDGETRWRPGLRTPVIWMAGIQHGRKDKLMRAERKQCALFITFSPSLSVTLTLSSVTLSHPPSVNVAVIFIVLMVSLWHKSFMVLARCPVLRITMHKCEYEYKYMTKTLKQID